MGYHLVDICSEHQAFLGFAWSIVSVLKYFTFTVLPFGLINACCFTKLLRPLRKRLRSMGHTNFVYLDGSFGSQPDKCPDIAAGIIQKKELDSAGLLVNREKSMKQPIQTAEWPGFEINTITMISQREEGAQPSKSSGHCSHGRIIFLWKISWNSIISLFRFS